jgi:hypothetical protein
MKINVRVLDRTGSGCCPMSDIRTISIIVSGSIVYLSTLITSLQIIKNIVTKRDFVYGKNTKD